MPVGDEFQVNSYTSGYQGRPSVAVDSSGNFVVVWDSPGSYGTDDDWSSVQGQRYDSAGQPLGGEFQINTFSTSFQRSPSVAADPAGNFVAVWDSYGSFDMDHDSWSVQGQRFDSSGRRVGGEFQINSYATSVQYRASVGVDSGGDFVVVWQSWGSQGTDSSASSIQAQRFDASGKLAGGEFQVNTYTTSHQRVPSVAVDPDGDFVVVWESYGSYGTDDDSWSIQGQRFDAGVGPSGMSSR